MLAVIRSVSTDESVRAVEIGGAGRAFSAGADLKSGLIPLPDSPPDVETRLHELYHPIILGVEYPSEDQCQQSSTASHRPRRRNSTRRSALDHQGSYRASVSRIN